MSMNAFDANETALEEARYRVAMARKTRDLAVGYGDTFLRAQRRYTAAVQRLRELEHFCELANRVLA